MSDGFYMNKFLLLLTEMARGYNVARNSVRIASMVSELNSKYKFEHTRLLDSIASLCFICNTSCDERLAESCDFCRFGMYKEEIDRLDIEKESEKGK